MADHVIARGAAALLLCLAPMLAPLPAAADAQVSARVGAGYGLDSPPDADPRGRFELLLRGDVVFGPPRVDTLRAGVGLDLRSASFQTAEAAAGGVLLVPTLTGAPFSITLGGGWASRPGNASSAFLLTTLSWGFRPYNYHSIYGFALDVYASARADLPQLDRPQVTFGVEVDLLFAVVIPAMFLWEWITGGDPDEP